MQIVADDDTSAFTLFADALGSRVMPGVADLFDVSQFSTSTEIDRQTAAIVMMHTTSSYFRYGRCTSCGIPWIELRGTADDWRQVRAKAEMLRQFDIPDRRWRHDGFVIENRLNELNPVLDQFVNACEGRVDRDFWGSISNMGGGSGGRQPTGKFVSGWVRAFYQNMAEGCSEAYQWVKEHGLDAAMKKANDHDDTDTEEMGVVDGESWPTCVSRVPVTVTRVDGSSMEVFYLASSVGYQRAEDGAIEVRNAWAVVVAGG